MTASPPDRRKGRSTLAAHDVPPAIQWHEGMLLAPQHFQWQSLRQESLLHYHAAAIAPFHWGVRHLEIDPALLVDGLFRVLALEAVMPDGLVVSVLPGEASELSVDLTQRSEEIRQRPLTIHLAVVARGRGLAFGERYASEERESVPDENTGDGEIAVPVLAPKVSLLLDEDPPPRFVTFPLAQVAYRNEAFARTRFEPPWLRVAPGSALSELCSGIAGRVREKANFLANQVHAPSASARSPQILETRALLHSLVGALPPFEAVLHSGVAHPFPLYLALCSLLGHTAALGRALVPPLLEPYDHNDLAATFEQARAAIFQVLDEGIQESYVGYTLTWEDGVFRVRFDPAWLGRPLVLGVRSPEGGSDAEGAAWVAAGLIAARSKIDALRDRRVVGLGRRQIEADSDLAPSRGVSLYALTPDPDLLIPGEELEIRHPDAGRRRPPEIVLYVKAKG